MRLRLSLLAVEAKNFALSASALHHTDQYHSYGIITLNNWHIRLSLLGAIFVTSVTSAYGQDVAPECRGVAAGVVAAMRASGEINSQEASQAAVVAARRACAAALEGGLESVADNAEPTETEKGSQEKEDPSIWDLLTRDVDRKAGNDRLRRLKQ